MKRLVQPKDQPQVLSITGANSHLCYSKYICRICFRKVSAKAARRWQGFQFNVLVKPSEQRWWCSGLRIELFGRGCGVLHTVPINNGRHSEQSFPPMQIKCKKDPSAPAVCSCLPFTFRWKARTEPDGNGTIADAYQDAYNFLRT